MSEHFPTLNDRKVLNRLYTYLERFKSLDRLEIDTLYVMTNIVFGDTSKEHQDMLRRILGK